MNTNPFNQHDVAFADAAKIIAELPPEKRAAMEEAFLAGWGPGFFQNWKAWCAKKG